MNNKSLEQRFWDKVIITDDCWLWIGSLDSGGYGLFCIGNSITHASRFSYQTYKNKILSTYQIDHLCNNSLCVNPNHLEAVTPRENTHRSNSPAGINSRKTHCLKGHEYDSINTRYEENGRRHCRICENSYKQIKKQKIIQRYYENL